MSHRTLINGTAYEISGGRTLVNGTGYKIKSGKTMIDGTAYEVGFGVPVTLTITGQSFSHSAESCSYIDIGGNRYTSDDVAAAGGTITVVASVGTEIVCTATGAGFGAGNIYDNTELVAEGSLSTVTVTHTHVIKENTKISLIDTGSTSFLPQESGTIRIYGESIEDKVVTVTISGQSDDTCYITYFSKIYSPLGTSTFEAVIGNTVKVQSVDTGGQGQEKLSYNGSNVGTETASGLTYDLVVRNDTTITSHFTTYSSNGNNFAYGIVLIKDN